MKSHGTSLLRALVGLSLLVLAPSAGAQVRVEPVFPPETPGFVFAEAEDAVATNFNKSATLDYSSSHQRTLILNAATAPSGASAYFARYALWVSEAGTYEFWYAGTPPGPRDEARASFASTLSWSVDGGPALPLAREDANVVEAASLTQYWVRAQAPVTLTAGAHTLEVRAETPRRSDGRYYLNLDALFLWKPSTPLPAPDSIFQHLPQKPADRSIDKPFLSLAQYEVLIQAQPQQPGLLVETAQVLSMLGDYAGAVKHLTKARLLAPADPSIVLALAKNKLWAGEADDAFQDYKTYLGLAPTRADVWAEDAKVLAWQGRTTEALEAYRQGLERNPGDLTLLVNQGLTYAWASRPTESDRTLAAARTQAGDDQDAWAALGQILEVNGYPDLALAAYRDALARFPTQLRFALAELATLVRTGRDAEAEALRTALGQKFVPSARLTAVFDTFSRKLGLQALALAQLGQQVDAAPDNLDLRESYIEALFWNGKKSQALKEHLNLLVDHLYRSWTEADAAGATLAAAVDRTAARAQALTRARGALAPLKARLDRAAAAVKALGPKTPADQADAARQALDAAEAEAGQAVADLQAHLTLAAADRAAVAATAAERQADAGRWTSLQQAQKWVWDRSGTLRDLARAGQGGLVLGPYLAARIALVEGRWKDAGALAAAVLKAAAPWKVRAKLWAGPGTPPVADEDLRGLGLADPALAPAAPLEAPALAAALPGLTKAADAELQALAQAAAEARGGLRTKMLLTLLAWDQAMAPLRSQIAEEALDLKDLTEARRQLDRVLALRPWDTRARFRLGNVAELQGDWARALELYRAVHLTDSQFDGAVTLFNRLAKAHPEAYESGLRLFRDSQRTLREATLAWAGDFGPAAGWRFDLAQTRPDLDAGGAADLTTASARLPLTLVPGVLRLTPALGAVADGLSGARASGGLEAALNPAGAVSLTVRAFQEPLTDTWLTAGDRLDARGAEATLGLAHAFPAPSALVSLSSRTYALGRLVTDGNLLRTAVEEVNLIVHAADNPWSNLTFSAVGSWEDSAQAAAGDRYYAPGGNLTAKGGVTGSTWLGLPGGTVLGLTARWAGGPYLQNQLRGTAETLFSQEATLRAEWTRGEATLYAAADGSAAGPWGGAASYWSWQGQVGFRLALAATLSP